ncbi:hypothetical protein O3P69_016490 [Scylla paramamosain]|uniref:UMA domain-containing protein n=1 Tax=Scylla paramamosain TaxID=85552 RepID=A0AAW0TG38_SCYPA
MFRIFGRRKSAAEGEETADAVEATEEKPEVSQDGFVLLDDSTQLNNGYGPPPGYTVGGANAFLPYGLEPKNGVTTQRSMSFEAMSAIDGIPFKFGSNVLLEEMIRPSSTTSTEDIMAKIRSFNWDDYEYSFELEKSIMREFESTEEHKNE